MIFNVTGGGGGVALNFKVLAYPDEATLLAATPAENTIGIITTTDISGWSMGDYPNPHWEMSEGYVYIAIKASSYGSDDLDFGVLKKGNEICIAPISAKQYVSGAWVDVACKSYQGWVWHDWWSGQIYQNGKFSDAFGELIGTDQMYAEEAYKNDTIAPTISNQNNQLTITMPSKTGASGAAVTSRAVDVTKFNTLSVTIVSAIDGTSSETRRIYVGLYTEPSGLLEDGVAYTTFDTNVSNRTYNVDISGITGECYAAIGVTGMNTEVTVVISELGLRV